MNSSRRACLLELSLAALVPLTRKAAAEAAHPIGPLFSSSPLRRLNPRT